MLKYSGYNILSKVKDSENYFIVNLLSGNADILLPSEAAAIEAIKDGAIPDSEDLLKELAEKGYITDATSEEKLYRQKYLEFLDSREKDEVQLFLVTNYSCNFACSYCYQDEYGATGKAISKEIADAFFAYVNQKFSTRRKYVTVFGGEPLLGSNSQKELISYIIEKATGAGLSLCFVTNGYHLTEYVPILKKGKIREIQVTLDGTADVHDSRRFLKGGGSTFDKITEGVDSALEAGLDINLRVVIDKDNINNLPDLAGFAREKGWTENPLFKTQIGRNYELHHCQSSRSRLFDRLSLYESLYELIKEHPHLEEFYKPSYSITKFLAGNGELPDPLFDSCPACKTEWAFDFTGKIYSCTATVGKPGEELGTFYPETTLNEAEAEKWEERDVTAIKECRSCSVQLACGGGCGSVAKNRTGTVCSPDCRPVKELMEIGFSAYFENSKNEINERNCCSRI